MLKANVILSISSIPERVDLFLARLDWLANQTLQPKRVIIWLGSEFFSEEQRLDLHNRFPLTDGIEIRYHHDIGPQTKLLYALREFGAYPIVTADDDVLYPPFWLEELYTSFQSAPQHIHCFRAHEIRTSADGQLLPYLSWNWLARGTKGPSALLFPTGTCGVIYPANSLSEHVFDEDVMKQLCPTNDDIWFKGMSLLKGTLVQKVREDSLEFPLIAGSQTRVLWKTNFERNDAQLKAVFQYYGLYDKLSDRST